MASIGINVSDKGLFEIVLDRWEWTGLTVNDEEVPPQPGRNPNPQFVWQQTVAGPVQFIAKANQFIDIVNPGNTMFLLDDGTTVKTAMAVISYSEANNVVTLNGLLHVMEGVVGNPVDGPIWFSQGRMTGGFAKTTN